MTKKFIPIYDAPDEMIKKWCKENNIEAMPFEPRIVDPITFAAVRRGWVVKGEKEQFIFKLKWGK